MTNLTTEYRRRISKLLDGKPDIAKKGTNHIDDEWSKDTIYKGEIGIDLNKGKLYTSDGDTAVTLNKAKMVEFGLQLIPVPGASSGANALWIDITSGKASINGKSYWHTSVLDKNSNEQVNGDFVFAPNYDNKELYYLIYAKPAEKGTERYEYDEETQESNLDFFAVKLDNESELYSDSFAPYTQEDLSNAILLGALLMPGRYTSSSVNKLRPWSVSVAESGIEYSFFDTITIDKEEETVSELLYSIKSGMCNYAPDETNKRADKVVIKGQVFTSGTSMYLVLETHYCESISQSLNDKKIVMFGSAGGSGGDIKMHSSLMGLTYAESGHIGFQRKVIVSQEEPNARNTPRDVHDGALWFKMSSDSSDAILEAGFMYYKNKWIEFVNSAKESYKYKNFQYDANAEFVFDYKQADTFIRLDVNGVGCNYDTDYYFKNSGGKVRFKDIDNKSPYKLVWCSQDYELDNEDSLSLSYLESNPIIVEMIIDSTDWNVVYGGSSSENISQE